MPIPRWYSAELARPYPVVIGGGWQQVSNKDREYTRWLVADIEHICPRTSCASAITGTVINLHLWVGSTGAGDIALKIGAGCTHRGGGQGIDGGGEGGDIEGKEDGIIGSGSSEPSLSLRLSESVTSPSSLL